MTGRAAGNNVGAARHWLVRLLAFVALLLAGHAWAQGVGTRFDNSWGGPSPNHYSTARDLATLASATSNHTQAKTVWPKACM